MTITFKKKPRDESGENPGNTSKKSRHHHGPLEYSSSQEMATTIQKHPGDECSENPEKKGKKTRHRHGPSENYKRSLRRDRKNAAKNGIFVEYEPRSQQPPEDAPKLTNTGKRMLRKRKKYAAHMAELGLTIEAGHPTYFKPEKRRKKNQLAESLGTNAANQPDNEPTLPDYKSAKPDTELARPDIPSTEPEKKKRKEKKKKNATSMTAGGNLLEENTGDKSSQSVNELTQPDSELPGTDVESAEPEKKKRKEKRKKNATSMTAAGNLLEENTGDKSAQSDDELAQPDEEPARPDKPDQAEDESSEPEKKKRRKQKKKSKNASSTIAAGNLLEENTGERQIKKEIPTRKQRFILFVGNLSYDVTEKEIRTHFAKVGKIESIRISKHVDKAMKGKSKGFAHLEVGNEESYLKALSMHHSMMDDRRINVEYSSVQTRDVRVAQKQRNRTMKQAMASGNILEFANPSKLKSKKNIQTEKRQTKQVASNKVWV